MPTWQAEAGNRVFLNPLDQGQVSTILAKSLIHLRRGGILLGAADMGTGGKIVTIEKMGYRRNFSLGLPTLARKVGSPVVKAIARWHKNRVYIEFTKLELPDPNLGEDDWNLVWLERYWDLATPILSSSPENLRFLREFIKIRPT